MRAVKMVFDGHLLKRGFWLYVWRVAQNSLEVLYVGRTGDSSSPNASSPFARVGQHLDQRPNARANALARQLRRAGINPESAKFELTAIGPIFEERSTFEQHVPLTDEMAALEKRVSLELKKRGYSVIGQHQSDKDLNEDLFDRVMRKLDESFPGNRIEKDQYV